MCRLIRHAFGALCCRRRVEEHVRIAYLVVVLVQLSQSHEKRIALVAHHQIVQIVARRILGVLFMLHVLLLFLLLLLLLMIRKAQLGRRVRRIG